MNKKAKLSLSFLLLSTNFILGSCLNLLYTYPILRPDQYRNEIMFVNTIGREKSATLLINKTIYSFSIGNVPQAMDTIKYTLVSEDTEGIFPKNIDHWYANWSLQKDSETGVQQLVVTVQDDFIEYYVGYKLILNRVSE